MTSQTSNKVYIPILINSNQNISIVGVFTDYLLAYKEGLIAEYLYNKNLLDLDKYTEYNNLYKNIELVDIQTIINENKLEIHRPVDSVIMKINIYNINESRLDNELNEMDTLSSSSDGREKSISFDEFSEFSFTSYD